MEPYSLMGWGRSEAQRVGRRAKGERAAGLDGGRLLLEGKSFTQSPSSRPRKIHTHTHTFSLSHTRTHLEPHTLFSGHTWLTALTQHPQLQLWPGSWSLNHH